MELRAPDHRVLDAVLAQPKRVALLVYLATARPVGFHRRDRLLALFWPELDDARARDALSQALRFLRQSLGSEVIISRGADEIGIDAAQLWCDATAFRATLDKGQPDDALRLYDGDFLDGFFVEEAAGFTEWVETERASLREVAARGARKLAEIHGERGDHTVAVAWGRRATELTPDDERAFRRLLGFFDGAGDHAGALQAYDAFARRLRADYGAEPAAETRAIIEAIRREVASAPIAPAVATPPDRAIRSPNSPSPAAGHGSLGSDPFDAGVSLADGRYIIDRVLGVGGMATVYLARDVRHQRQVAVKVLKPSVAPSVDAEGLLREIRIAANLQHPHIVPLFDSGESGGRVFYVMPYVMGESLGARLRRDPSLPLDLALRIAGNVARALAYAHAHGIVHRDIKPDNVLLSGDATGELHAMVSDFGLAKAIDASRSRASLSGDRTLTPFGGMVGTPRYMSPEQAVGDAVDCRADLYSWGVLTYEMLAGTHPFDAQLTPRQLIAAHINTDPEPLSSRRADVPPAVASLVMRCLEKEPERRPADGAALVAGLDGNVIPPALPVPRRPRRRHQWAAGVGALVVLGGGMWGSGLWRARAPKGAFGAEAPIDASVLDTTRYAVLPFAYDSKVAEPLYEVQQLGDALSRWTGIHVVDQLQLGDALSRRGLPGTNLAAIQRLATDVKAGRFVAGSVVRLSEGLRIEATLYDTRSTRALRSVTRRIDPSGTMGSVVFDALADSLLFRDSTVSARVALVGTRNPAALQAFARGQRFLEQWDLARADSEFALAARRDEHYAQAHLWLAQVRVWRDEPVTDWRIATQEAARRRAQLSSRDQALADALGALASGDVARACATWARLSRLDPNDFANWYGLGRCLRSDSLVMRDRTSPSGWRFRSSYHQSAVAFRKAFDLFPSIHSALSPSAFEQTRILLLASGSGFVRSGYPSPPDTGLFLGLTGLDHDTLAFVPFPAAMVRGGAPGTVPPTLRSAITRQQLVFKEIADGWAAAFPQSAKAVEAVAVSREMLGDPSALDMLHRARSLASTPGERVRLAAAEVLVRVKLALPSDRAGLLAARALADSLLRAENPIDTSLPRLLASIAALTGRAQLAASYMRQPSVTEIESAGETFAADGLALGMYSAMGGPVDTLRALEQRVERAIHRTVVDSARASARLTWLMRPAVLAFPSYRFASLSSFAGLAWPPIEAEVALTRGDRGSVRRILDDAADRRRLFAPSDLTFDALYPEAYVLAEIGDDAGAVQRIDPTLRALAETAPEVFTDPARAASLVRAMVLRAQLAARTGDTAAARTWARPVTVLWENGDAFVQPLVREMNQLAR